MSVLLYLFDSVMWSVVWFTSGLASVLTTQEFVDHWRSQ